MSGEDTKDIGDISVADKGNIHVYADKTQTKYWVVHEDNEKIFFPEESSYLFSSGEEKYYTNLTTLTFKAIDTGNVAKMRGMFFNCENLESLDLKTFNTINVTDMGGMFAGCSALTDLDLSSFYTGKVTNMEGMFNRCEKLTDLDVSRFNTGNVRSEDTRRTPVTHQSRMPSSA